MIMTRVSGTTLFAVIADNRPGMLTASVLRVEPCFNLNEKQPRMAAQHAFINTEKVQPPETRARGTLRYGWIGLFSAILRLIYIPRSLDEHRVQGSGDTCFPRLKNVLRWVQLASFVLFGVVAGFEFFTSIPKVGGLSPVSVLTMARSFALSPLGTGSTGRGSGFSGPKEALSKLGQEDPDSLRWHAAVYRGDGVGTGKWSRHRSLNGRGAGQSGCWCWLATGVLLESARREVERRGRGVLNPLISATGQLPVG